MCREEIFQRSKSYRGDQLCQRIGWKVEDHRFLSYRDLLRRGITREPLFPLPRHGMNLSVFSRATRLIE